MQDDRRKYAVSLITRGTGYGIVIGVSAAIWVPPQVVLGIGAIIAVAGHLLTGRQRVQHV
jgi:hypothetical protein